MKFTTSSRLVIALVVSTVALTQGAEAWAKKAKKAAPSTQAAVQALPAMVPGPAMIISFPPDSAAVTSADHRALAEFSKNLADFTRTDVILEVPPQVTANAGRGDYNSLLDQSRLFALRATLQEVGLLQIRQAPGVSGRFRLTVLVPRDEAGFANPITVATPRIMPEPVKSAVTQTSMVMVSPSAGAPQGPESTTPAPASTGSAGQASPTQPAQGMPTSLLPSTPVSSSPTSSDASPPVVAPTPVVTSPPEPPPPPLPKWKEKRTWTAAKGEDALAVAQKWGESVNVDVAVTTHHTYPFEVPLTVPDADLKEAVRTLVKAFSTAYPKPMVDFWQEGDDLSVILSDGG